MEEEEEDDCVICREAGPLTRPSCLCKSARMHPGCELKSVWRNKRCMACARVYATADLARMLACIFLASIQGSDLLQVRRAFEAEGSFPLDDYSPAHTIHQLLFLMMLGYDLPEYTDFKQSPGSELWQRAAENGPWSMLMTVDRCSVRFDEEQGGYAMYADQIEPGWVAFYYRKGHLLASICLSGPEAKRSSRWCTIQ